MPRYIGVHVFGLGPPPEDIERFQEAALEDPQVLGYRSVVTQDGGKCVCVLEATGQDEVVEWFEKIGLSADSISVVDVSPNRVVSAWSSRPWVGRMLVIACSAVPVSFQMAM